jgi:hypothetical protein
MAILESLKQFATGKSESERKQYAVRNRIIRVKARAAAFEEKERQEIRLAVARQKIHYGNKIKNISRKRKGFDSVDIFGMAKSKITNTKPFKII